MAGYLTFCLFPLSATVVDDPIFARIAAEHGLGKRRPGLVVGEEQGMRRVLVSAQGDTALFDAAQLVLQVSEPLALALMDAVEEAIEDAREGADPRPPRIDALEQTLALMERAFDDERPLD
jgi:hypothetical protein